MLRSRSRGQRLQVGLGFTGGYEEEGEREEGCQYTFFFLLLPTTRNNIKQPETTINSRKAPKTTVNDRKPSKTTIIYWKLPETTIMTLTCIINGTLKLT